MALSNLGISSHCAWEIGHEIKNPLTVMKLVLGQLDSLIEAEPYDRTLIKKKLTILMTSTTRIEDIVNSLQSFSTPQARLPFQLTDPLDIIRDSLDFCGPRLKAMGCEVEVKKTVGLKPVSCSKLQISQVLINLLNNSCDAMACTKKKNIQISLKDLGESIEIRVMDSGIGIPLGLREKIFEPFFTFGKSTGTGLGLSISRKFVTAHHGDLFLDNKSEYTCFVIYLPKNQDVSEK